MSGGGGISAPPSPAHDIGHNPYSANPGQADAEGYMGVNPYGQNQNAYNQNTGTYRGAPRGAPGMGGRGPVSPNGYGAPSQDGSGRGYAESEYESGRGYAPSQASSGRGFAPLAPGSGRGGYGPPSPQDPYGSSNNVAASGYARQGSNTDPNGRGQGYRAPPSRQYSGHSTDPRPGMNQRQYTDQTYRADEYQQSAPPRGPSRGPGPGPQNNSGFDFGTGGQDQYSRPAPQQQPYGSGYQGGSTAPPSYASRSPPPQETNYRAYGQGGGGVPQAMMPGGGRSREPQPWDPVQQR